MLDGVDASRVNNEISIALCTCEGSLFLPDLLESLSMQSCLPGEVVVCDDASTDDTAAVVESFTRQAPFLVRFVANDKRLGTVKNFGQAISLCQGKYIALCDQDDLWKANKLELTIAVLREAEKANGINCPLLVHTDLEVIDAQGSVISPSSLAIRRLKQAALTKGNLNSLLVQNHVTGCTVLMNRALAEASQPMPSSTVMHDYWLALVAAALGRLIYLDQPTVLYRQHQANVIGASDLYAGNSLKRLLDFRKLESELAAMLSQAAALERKLRHDGLDEQQWLGSFLKAMEDGGIRAFKAALQQGVLKQGLARNIVYLLMLLMGSYRRY